MGPFAALPISIHAPREGSDAFHLRGQHRVLDISIHAPREGSDQDNGKEVLLIRQNFYPRSPRGERPPRRLLPSPAISNFYPRSPRGERPEKSAADAEQSAKFLSTLPARGATIDEFVCEQPFHISIHAPREGSDGGCGQVRNSGHLFLSTLPARGATGGNGIQWVTFVFLSTLPARGATPVRRRHVSQHRISIHAPREGSDDHWDAMAFAMPDFYPRSPRGERRRGGHGEHPLHDISIHAPREGSDVLCAGPLRTASNFYPRSPRGERPHALTDKELEVLISIHAPREGSDLDIYGRAYNNSISIHAPREGSDLCRLPMSKRSSNFYPRSPRGERPDYIKQDNGGTHKISIHAPREGSDDYGKPTYGPAEFLSTLPARGATKIPPLTLRGASYFYPRSPRGERRGTGCTSSAPCSFLSTLPARGATQDSDISDYTEDISIHAPREGSDAFQFSQGQSPPRISIHAPREGSDR